MAIFMKHDKCPGNATAEGYKDFVRIDSMQFGVGRGISMEVGNLANRESSKPSISEITCTTEVDKCLTPLFKEAVSGSAGSKVRFAIVQTGADKLVEFLTIDLVKVLVSGWSFSVEGDSKGFLTFSLSFTEIDISYTDYDGSNKGGSPMRSGYQLEIGKAS